MINQSEEGVVVNPANRLQANSFKKGSALYDKLTNDPQLPEATRQSILTMSDEAVKWHIVDLSIDSIYIMDDAPFQASFKEESLGFKQYSQVANSTAIYPEDQAITYTLLGLVGETGEIAEKVKKSIRDGKVIQRSEMVKELGDVLWYLNAVAKEFDTSLEEVAKVNNDKLLSRQSRGKLQGSGDNR